MSPALQTRRGERADGFTLVELMISVTILALIAGAVGMTFIFTVRTTSTTSERFDEARGPKFASVYWQNDVASSESVDPSSGACGGGAPLVSLRSTSYANGDTTTSWVVVTSGASSQLVRRLCTNGNLLVPARSTVVAPGIVASGTTVTCDGGSCGVGSAPRLLTLGVQSSGNGRYSIDATRHVT